MKRVIKVDTKFYTFSQNNSGGYFELNEKDGIAECVIIEATSKEEASSKAKIIFQEYSDFCECCGERWSLNWTEGHDEPMIYSESAREAIMKPTNSWFKKNAAIHYYDNRMEWLERLKTE